MNISAQEISTCPVSPVSPDNPGSRWLTGKKPRDVLKTVLVSVLVLVLLVELLVCCQGSCPDTHQAAVRRLQGS